MSTGSKTPNIPPGTKSNKLNEYNSFANQIVSDRLFESKVAKFLLDSTKEQEEDGVLTAVKSTITISKTPIIDITEIDKYLDGMQALRLIYITQNTNHFIVSIDEKIGTKTVLWEEDSPTPQVSPKFDVSYIDEIHLQDAAPDLLLLHYAKVQKLVNEIQFRALCELVDIAYVALPQTIYDLKKKADVGRPNINSDRLLPMPKHQSWPGGHAFWSSAIAVLISLSTNEKTFEAELLRIAKRIGMHRERAGIHWHEDTISGLKLGKALMEGLIVHISKNAADFPTIYELVRRVRN